MEHMAELNSEELENVEFDADNSMSDLYNFAAVCGCENCQLLRYLQQREQLQQELLQSYDLTLWNPLASTPNFLSFLEVDNTFFSPWNWNREANNTERNITESINDIGSDIPMQYMSFEADSFFENFDGFKYVEEK